MYDPPTFRLVQDDECVTDCYIELVFSVGHVWVDCQRVPCAYRSRRSFLLVSLFALVLTICILCPNLRTAEARTRCVALDWHQDIRVM